MNSFIYPFVSLFGATTPANDGGGGQANTTDCPHKVTNVLACDATGDGSIWNLVATIVNFLSIGVGVAVLGGIIWGAFLYSSAGGNAAQAQKGVGYVRNAVIALALYIFMYAIIQFIIPGGLF